MSLMWNISATKKALHYARQAYSTEHFRIIHEGECIFANTWALQVYFENDRHHAIDKLQRISEVFFVNSLYWVHIWEYLSAVVDRHHMFWQSSARCNLSKHVTFERHHGALLCLHWQRRLYIQQLKILLKMSCKKSFENILSKIKSSVFSYSIITG